ncbi:MAG: HAMP domain-containing histidine kinase, partial [Lachnospiraceae bacterium]|nr:HAMP domain-containing histidine kinase [Lachnospiraceae bacterium]
MKNKILKTYYGRTVLNVIFSSIVFFIVVIFALYNTIIVRQEKNINIFNQSFIVEILNGTFLSILLSILLALVAFTLTYIFLEHRRNKYIEYIYDSVERISKGDLTKEIKVISEDELSLMARNLNLMQVRIRKLIENERLSEKSKNELITNIAHDLRTPLTSILGYLELLENNKSIDDTQREKYTKVAFEKSKKLEVLVEDLFSYTKMTYGKLAINVENIDIVRLLNQLVDELYPLFEKEDIVCEIKSKINSMHIIADPKLLARLFENLVNNAIKYGKEGKRIDIVIDDLEDEDKVMIRVINYGKLIPKESLDK